jgi:hypothetical protein
MSTPSPGSPLASKAEASPQSELRVRLTTAFGWVAGVCAGVLLNGLVFRMVGDDYPQIPTTFVAVVIGAFGGMAIADKTKERGFRPLGIAAGLLLAIVLWFVAAMLMAPPAESPV